MKKWDDSLFKETMVREEKLKMIRDKLKDKIIRNRRRRRKLFETEKEKEERKKEA